MSMNIIFRCFLFSFPHILNLKSIRSTEPPLKHFSFSPAMVEFHRSRVPLVPEVEEVQTIPYWSENGKAVLQ